MIQMETVLQSADNSGAKRVKCFKVIGGSKRRYASVGDIIVVSIKEALPNSKVKKGTVHKAVVVRTADGGWAKIQILSYADNAYRVRTLYAGAGIDAL